MKKKHPDGTLKLYDLENADFSKTFGDWYTDMGEIERGLLSTEPNIECDCGGTHFEICWWDYPHTGGYCKIQCANCKEELVLIDDYA